MKKCSKCKIIKNINEFYSSKKSKSGVRSGCKECEKNKSDNYEQTLKGKHARMLYNNSPITHNKVLLRKFGITLEEYNKMLKQQNNKCAICKQGEIKLNKYGKPKRLSVDHDHKTNKIRGLLCHTCNTGIGLLKDDIEIIKNALIYLSL